MLDASFRLGNSRGPSKGVSKSDQTGAVMSYYHRAMGEVLPTAFAPYGSSPMRPAPVSSDAGPERRRRSGCRYPVVVDVDYQLMKNREILSEGYGHSLNISRGGIFLETAAVLPVGFPIALQVSWPVKLDQGVDLILHIQGRTLRSEGNHTAVAISRYQFRARCQALTAGAGATSI
jgi:hypothetical protein